MSGTQLTNLAATKMGVKPASTAEFIGFAVQWLEKRSPVTIEIIPQDQRHKVTHGERFNSSNTLAIALANAVIDQT